MKGAEGKLYRETAVTADFHRPGRGQLLAGGQQPFAGGELFLIMHPFDGHTAEAVLHLGIDLHRFGILSHAGNNLFLVLDGGREGLEQLIFQPVLLALVVRFENLEPGHLDIQVHLLLDKRVSGAQRLDLSIAESLFVYVVTGSDGRFRGHDLGDEPLLVLKGLEQVGIEGPFGDVVVDLHFFVPVALADDTAIALGHIRGLPAHI